MRPAMIKWITGTVLMLVAAGQVMAQDIIMVRSAQTFPETMSTLQNTIIAYGYKITRVQRVDIGLTKAGYKTDRYRIVFFGKHREIKPITDKYPELIPYLPLKIVIFSEEDETILTALNPLNFSNILDKPDLDLVYHRWANDIRAIMDEVRKAE